jgi:hypothetical protein
MRRQHISTLSESIAALLRRLQRLTGAGAALPARRSARRPLTVIGCLPAAKRIQAANDPDAR